MSVRKRNDGQWGYDITKKSGGVVLLREKKFGYTTKAAAKRAEDARRAELLAGAPAKGAAPTFRELAQEVMVLHASPHNKRSEVATKRSILDHHLLPHFGDTKVDAIDVRAIAVYRAEKLAGERPLKAKTVNNHLTVLHKCLSLAVDWKYIARAPKAGFLKVPKPEIVFLSFEEVPRVLEATEGTAWRTMVLLALRAGLRQGEILALEWEDVDLARGVLHVHRSVWCGELGTTKGGRARDVPIGDELRAALRDLPSRRAGRLVFPGDGDKHLTKNACKWPLWSACRRAGVRRLGWHKLRHTFASHLVMRGASLKVVQELLGHATIEMTMRYAHLAPSVSHDAVRLLDAPAAALEPKKTGTAS